MEHKVDGLQATMLTVDEGANEFTHTMAAAWVPAVEGIARSKDLEILADINPDRPQKLNRAQRRQAERDKKRERRNKKPYKGAIAYDTETTRKA